MCAVPCAAFGPNRTLLEESSRCASVLLPSRQKPLLCYTQHRTTSTIIRRYVWALNATAKLAVLIGKWQTRYNVHSKLFSPCCRLLSAHHLLQAPISILLLSAACPLLAACCMLHNVCCRLLAVVDDMFHTTPCSLLPASRLYIACCTLFAVSCVLLAA